MPFPGSKSHNRRVGIPIGMPQSPWNFLSHLVEAKSDAALIRAATSFMTHKYGEHAADGFTQMVQRLSHDDLVKKVWQDYSDPHLSALVADLGQLGQKKAPDEPKRGPGRPPGSGAGGQTKMQAALQRMKDRGPEVKAPGSEPIPARPDRVPGMTPHPVQMSKAPTLKAGESQPYVQGVGSAGQNHPKAQPERPMGAAGQRQALRHALPKMPVHKPGDAAAKLAKQAELDALSAKDTKSSGLVDAQKRVDHVTLQYGQAHGERMAKQLGVPSSAERGGVLDPKTKEWAKETDEDGEEKVQRPAVWPSQKVTKMMDPDMGGIGAKDPGTGVSPGSRTDLLRKAAAKQTGASQEPERDVKFGNMKQPVQVKNNAPGQGDEPPFDGSFKGQVWRPNGMSTKMKARRADLNTGNFIYGSRESNPALTGKSRVWDGTRWTKMSEWVVRTVGRRLRELSSDASGGGVTLTVEDENEREVIGNAAAQDMTDESAAQSVIRKLGPAGRKTPFLEKPAKMLR